MIFERRENHRAGVRIAEEGRQMAVQVERRTIDVIPDSERHGSPGDQFTLWFGANMQITAIVDGALAVVFGADALWAIIGLLIGNIAGGIVMALHSAQGRGWVSRR